MANTMHDTLYDTPAHLFTYLSNAIPRALAWHLQPTLLPGDRGWRIDTAGTGFVDESLESGIHFKLVVDDPARSGRPELHVRGTVTDGDGTVHARLHTWGEAWEEEGMAGVEEVVRGMMMAGDASA